MQDFVQLILKPPTDISLQIIAISPTNN